MNPRKLMPTSVMPKGVEHPVEPVDSGSHWNMPTSVMPKGVEHTRNGRLAARQASNAHLCDAERR